MRLIVVAPNTEEGKWAAKQARNNIIQSVGYFPSRPQMRLFTAEDPDACRGFTLRAGDHVFYVEGWDKDEQLALNWGLVDRGETVWSAYHRAAPVRDA